MEALLGGSVDVTAATLSQAIQLATRDREVKCFVSLYTRPPIALAVAPAMADTIREPRDLKGHRVGVASPGSASHQFLAYLLTTHGLALSDVDAVSLGTGAPSIAALEHGTVDAGILLAAAIPAFERKHPGAAMPVDTRTPEGASRVFGGPEFPNACLAAQQNWLQAHPADARRLVRAVRKAMQWMKTHTAEEVREAMAPSRRMPDADAELQAICQAQATLSADGTMSADAAQRIARYAAAFGDTTRLATIDVAKTYTNDFVRPATAGQ